MKLSRNQRLILRLADERRLLASIKSDGWARRIAIVFPKGATTLPDEESHVGRVNLHDCMQRGWVEVSKETVQGRSVLELTTAGRWAFENSKHPIVVAQ